MCRLPHTGTDHPPPCCPGISSATINLALTEVFWFRCVTRRMPFKIPVMHRNILVVCAFVFIGVHCRSQLVLHTNAASGDTMQPAKTRIEGYVDAYYGFDFNQPKTSDRLYAVSQSRHNEVNINLAYISLKYAAPRVRATLTPGFGTYMNANYAAEKITLRNLVEANVGVKPFKDKNIWIDAGVLPSPYTNESAISFDQLLYTRSMASENVPYYLTGARVSIPVTAKLSASLYLLNGWQVISDVNNPLGFGANIEYKPSDHIQLDWDVYAGNERSEMHPGFKNRYYTDAYLTWSKNKLTWTTCVFGGIQQEDRTDHSLANNGWWQANTAARYAFAKTQSVSARVEYYNDPSGIFIQPATGVTGFTTFSESLCYNLNLDANVLFRVEARYYQSGKQVYVAKDQSPANNDFLIVAGITARF